MKKVAVLLCAMAALSCEDSRTKTAELAQRVDSLRTVIGKMYRPGFGEMMSAIQSHHAKLWFAGKNRNWELAEFEVHEIAESMEAIREFQQDRPESRELPMIAPYIDSLARSIQAADTGKFAHAYGALTEACNACHRSTRFGFNRVKQPEAPPVTNQEFKPED